nr:hypothetical protein [Tanacetum cinerariifolium]GEW71123.1 hypothetical protein [Tanacetum cinerariifolium]
MVMSGCQRSKEDDVQKISTSVFVTNFPDGTKAGKRFGFVRFIKVLDIDRLISNLCTVWVGRNKIHANVARSQREPLNKQSNKVNNKGTNNVNHGAKGKVKEFASLTNLLVVLGKEGYTNIELKYMGGFWVMIVFQDDETKKRHDILVRAIEVPGWVPEFEKDGEEGYDVNDGSHENDMHGGVSENFKDVEVSETNFEEVPDKSIFKGNFLRQNDVHYEDPFGIYEVLKRNGENIDDKYEDSLKYPPGFTPNEEGDVPVEKVDNWSDENRVNDGQEDGVCVGQQVHEWMEASNDTHESTCYGHFKKSEVPRKGGSILELIDDLVNMG